MIQSNKPGSDRALTEEVLNTYPEIVAKAKAQWQKTILDREVEEVLASCVSEGEKLLVPFYAGRVDGAHIVVADALADVPRGVVLAVV